MIKLRLFFLLSVFMLIFGVILYRAVQLQLMPHDRIESFARRQGLQRIEMTGRRGTILDRDGKELAISVNSVSLFAHPGVVQKPKRVARVLGGLLGVSEKSILAKLDLNKKFVWLARQLSTAQMRKLEKIDLKSLTGVGVLPEYRRAYPMGRVAAHALGFVSVDGRGLEGVERKFEESLVGEKNIVRVRKDALGRWLITQKDRMALDLVPGEKVELSVEANLQHHVEKALSETVAKHDALGGTAIVMDPYTGEILALANSPDYDPNRASDVVGSARRNRAVSDPIEPGSVLKAFVVARALDDRIVTPTTKISAGGGFIQIGRKRIGEAEASHRFESVSVSDLIRVSSNVATVNLAQKIGFARVESTFRQVGFDKITGVELPGESKGIFPQLKKTQLLEQATMSFGQGIAVTPLQIASAYAVFANGGYRVRPRILKATGDEAVDEGDRVFSMKTVKQMRRILEAVVESEGTGKLAQIGAFKVAGKTGTSQKVDYVKGGYESGAYLASFAGFLPADNPRFVIYVMIDHPRKGGYYGSEVAAPLFAKIAREAVRLPSTAVPSIELANKVEAPTLAPGPQGRSEQIPDLSGKSLRAAFAELQKIGLQAEATNVGTRVDAQFPGAGKRGDTNLVYLKLRD